MVLSIQRELGKGLLTLKVSKVPASLNAIAVGHECDLIINVQRNGSILHGMLVDGGAKVNVMTIHAMRYLRLKLID
jgi:hypothetical protein